MALTYVPAASWSTGGTNSGTGYYKDFTFTSVAVGDLLMVGALGESANYSSGVRSITTQSGTTGTWTLVQPAAVTASDADALGGFATATSSGTIVVRVQIRTAGAAPAMGVSGVRIPAAEWTGTPVGFTIFNDADGQVSVTLPGGSTYTVVYWGDDYNASTASTGVIPTTGTNRESVLVPGAHTVFVRTWTAQASGTRNYGPGATTTNASLTGLDVTGFAIYVPEAGGASNQTVIPTGIPSAAATGTPTLTTATTVVPDGIPSAAASGTPTVSTSTTVIPTGIPSAETSGTPTLTTAITVVPTGVPSEAAVGTPTITMGEMATVEITRVALTVVPAVAAEATVEITRVALYVTPQTEPTQATVEITRVMLSVVPSVEPTEATVEITGVRLFVTAQVIEATVEITGVRLYVTAAPVVTYEWQERVAGVWVDPDWIIMERRAGVWVPLDS